MATHVFDDKHDGTIRPVEKVRPGVYSCEVTVGLRTGELTRSSFVGEGSTARRAKEDAIAKARQAIQSGLINY